jgi:hypothetical protein
MSDVIVLELGDVLNIQFKDEPSNDEPFLINYIDEDRIDLMNLETEDILIIPISNKRIQEYDVEKITLLTRNTLKGYALQHGLTKGKNIRMSFVGVKQELVGEILETRNDIITILLEDTLEILYINFGYKGLPNELAIRYIEPFKPTKKNETKESSIDKIYEYLEKQNIFDGEKEVSVTQITEQILNDVEGFNVDMRPWITFVIRKYIDKLNEEELEKDIDKEQKEKEEEEEEKYGEPEGEAIIGLTEKSKSKLQYEVNEADRIMKEELFYNRETPQQQLVDELFEDEEDPNQPFHKYERFYSLEEQVKDMLDDYLSRIPTEQRTPVVINKIHNIIQRYTQLRTIYIVSPPIQYPLYDSLKHFSKEIGWLIPVVAQSLSTNEDDDEETLNQKFREFIDELKNVTDQYNSDVDNRYEDYLMKIDTIYSNIYERDTNDGSDCLVQEPVSANLTVISKLDENPYITKYLSTPIYSEVLCLLSILTLPYTAVRYSRVYGHMASIYDASNIMEKTNGISLFKLLNKSSSINNVYVGGQGENEESPSVVDITEINNYSLVGTNNFDTLLQHVLREEINITKYLNSIPYSTKGIGFSIYKLSGQLEPFQIYYDRLKVEQSVELNHILKKRINTYKRLLKKNKKAFEKLEKGVKLVGTKNSTPNHFKEILYGYEKNITTLNDVYANILSTNNYRQMTPTEVILLVNRIDCGEYYNFILSSDKLSHEMELTKKGIRKNEEFPYVKFVKARYPDEYHLKGLPFKPIELTEEELILKNNPEIYDLNLYNELNKVSKTKPSEEQLTKDKERIRLLREEVKKMGPIASKNMEMEYTQVVPNIPPAPVVPPPPSLPGLNPETLQPPPSVARGEMTVEMTGENVEDMSGGTKKEEEPVLPPQFAKVTVLPVGKGGKEYCKNVEVVKIYIDIDDIHRDSDIDIESTNLPTPRPVVEGDYALLLESNNAVSYYIRTNNRWRQDVTIKTNNLYETPAMFCNMGLWCVRDFTRKKCIPMQDLATLMVQQLIMNMPSDKINDGYIEYVKNNFINQTERSISIVKLNESLLAKYDQKKLNLGLTRDFVDIVVSPYIDLFLTILADKNFGKRQNDLINFCMEYTRKNDSSNNLETPYWRYCKDTGVQLVPTSLYTIAGLYNMYSKNINKFQEQLELVKKDIGILSEDGAYIIDKYTGFKISEIVFDYSEEYDEAGFLIKTRDVITDVEKEEKEMALKKELMSTQDAKYIRYIIGFISEKMSINLQKQVEFIVRTVINTLITKKPSKTMKDTYLMFLTLGMIVIAIQTSIPNVVSKKTFPNCKEKFIGYPLTGDQSDMGAIEYMACVISYAKQPGIPWNVLSKFNVEGMKDLIKKMIVDYLITNSEVQSKITEKTSYLLSSKVELIIPEEHNIKKWKTYLPALEKLDIEQVRNVTEDVLSLIRSRPTTDGIDLLFSKIYQFSLGIQSKIQRIIKKKANTALLKTSLNIPFVENACCIDHTPNSVIGYFEREEPIIKKYIEIASELTKIIYNVNRIYKSPQVLSLINTKRIYPEIGTEITQTTIYAAFVFQIKQDIINDIGRLPENAEISSETKKEQVVKVFDTLEENINRLKEAGISYTKADFDRLLKNRFSKGIIPPEEIYTPHKRTLLSITEELENIQIYIMENPENPHILPLDFVKTFLSTINNEKQGLPRLKTFLNNENKKFLTKIKTFMSRTKSKTFKYVDGLLESFVNPEIMVEMTTTLLKNITQVYPAIIGNKTKNNVTTLDIPKYWDISPQHQTDLIRVMLEKYKLLEVFYENEDVVSMVRFMKDNTKSFMSLVNKLGIYYKDFDSYKLQNPEQTVLDLAAVGLLFKYFVYIIYIQYLNLGENVEGRIVPPKVVASMMDTFFEIFMDQKAVVNKEMKDVADSVINIKNIEKNRMLDELAKLTSDEHQSNKVLKVLKLKRWSMPKNLRAYTKSGYDKEEGIFDEDDAFRFSTEDEEGYDAEETGENDETFAYDLDEEEKLEEDFDFDMDWRELVGDEGDAGLEDGDYLNVDIEELNK